MASGFDEAHDQDGYIVKARAKFGKNKEVCVNFFNGRTYLHISDVSKCFVDGRFDLSKSKGVSLNLDEALTLHRFIQDAQMYDTTFQQIHQNKQQQQQQQQPQPQPQPWQQQQQQQQQHHQQQQQFYPQDQHFIHAAATAASWDDSNLIAVQLQPEEWMWKKAVTVNEGNLPPKKRHLEQ